MTIATLAFLLLLQAAPGVAIDHKMLGEKPFKGLQ